MEESDPRYLRQPNFYFTQEDILWRWCTENHVGWNVTRPGFIVGAVPDAAMNLTYGIALYASLSKELNKTLDFPADIAAWEAEKHLSSAMLIAYHAEWTVLTEGAKDQILNIADDSMFTYGKFWPVLAQWYGLSYGVPSPDTDAYRTFTMPQAPPPRGFGPAGQIKTTSSLEEWSMQPSVKETWTALRQKYNLSVVRDPIANAKDYFGLVDTDVLGPWGRSIR